MSPSVFLHMMEEGNNVYKGQFSRIGVLTEVAPSTQCGLSLCWAEFAAQS